MCTAATLTRAVVSRLQEPTIEAGRAGAANQRARLCGTDGACKEGSQTPGLETIDEADLRGHLHHQQETRVDRAAAEAGDHAYLHHMLQYVVGLVVSGMMGKLSPFLLYQNIALSDAINHILPIVI